MEEKREKPKKPTKECRRCKDLTFNRRLVSITKTDKPPIHKPIIWVLGGPGVGKGTQCEKIVAKYGFTHLATGDLLRAEVKEDSERAKSLISIMGRGELVPNDIVLDLLREAIEKHLPQTRGFLIDGYPRVKSQGIAFEKTIAPVTVIIFFEAPIETLYKRLLVRAMSSRRIDDHAEAFKLKLQTFHENIDLVLTHYREKLKRINAERPADAIFVDVQEVLDPIVEQF